MPGSVSITRRDCVAKANNRGLFIGKKRLKIPLLQATTRGEVYYRLERITTNNRYVKNIPSCTNTNPLPNVTFMLRNTIPTTTEQAQPYTSPFT